MAGLRKRRPGLVYPVHEDWRYVGEAGEPAFGTNWSNSGTTDEPATAFRIRETGIVDLNINAQNTVAPGATEIFTLPAKYRPSRLSFTQAAFGQAGVSTGGSHVGVLKIFTNGQITPVNFRDESGSTVNPELIVGQFQFYRTPPLAIADI